MSSESIVPAAQGQLRDRPVPRIIQQVFRKRLTGRVVITDDAGDMTCVYVRDGFPVHADRPNDIDRLDRILIAAGMVSAQVIAQANDEVRKNGRRLGDLLVMKGVITRETLAEVLKTQMRRKLTRLFFARQGRYDIYADSHHFGDGDEFESTRLDPRAILYPGIRSAYDDERLKQELEPLSGHTFRLISVPAGFLEAMGFAAGDPTVKGLGNRRLTLDKLSSLGVKTSDARAVVLALLYSDLLDAGAQAAQPAAPVAPPPSAADDSGPVLAPAGTARTTWTSLATTTEVVMPSRSAPRAPSTPGGAASADSLRVALTQMHQKLDTLSYFDLLGIPESAPAPEINAAYMRAVRQYHPDRLAASGLRDLAAQAERVVARMGEAAAILSDPQRRSDYLAGRGGKSTGAPAAMAVMDAENRFQKGEVFLKKGDFAKAVESFGDAAKLNPAEPQFKAFLVWARFEDPRARKEVVAREALAVIGDCVRERPKFARGFYWIGQIYKFLNDPDRAEKAFRDAAEADHTLLEAEREVRLLEMRRIKANQTRPASTGPATAAKPGLFGKIFKRDN